MDKKDLKLLDILQKQGRISIADLADKMNMSDTPCLRRVKKLEQDKVITSYHAQLDPQKLDLNVSAFIDVRLADCSVIFADKFEQDMAQLVNVMECAVVTGEYDYLLKVVVRDLLSLERLIKHNISNLDNVSYVSSTVVMKPVFSRTTLPLE
ncbi:MULTISPECIES: Lrp/AsnC family transcriptional regulator [Pseudomonadati]|uniref:Lrp/AsnC family transcriptional regulator n=1 Tax=Shewanella aestuarii TaxID=1028752 RepID=A0ABT0L3E8_9GAMM|nr:Lrp/AsnC family transcriptional regulator [Shewanella aestuarii]MCL1118236.1 Lrp/AsnC family transcriptional regulator [Shewanella aestuarii]GGN80134.1 AsnC family transcriptional regulator [Shewanella aestuarii]